MRSEAAELAARHIPEAVAASVLDRGDRPPLGLHPAAIYTVLRKSDS